MSSKEEINNSLDIKDLSLMLNELRKYFLTELTLLKDVCDSVLIDRALEVKIILLSSCSTGTAIHKLGEKPEYFYSEMIMLSRSLIEKITNFVYLQVAEKNEYQKFLLHPYYRAFHNSDKSKYTAKARINILYNGKEGLKSIPKVAEALDAFSETNSKKDWSSKNVDQKISLISKKTKIKTEFFLINTLMVYSNASEALHGSFYGCALATGAFTPEVNTKDLDSVNQNVLKNTALLYAQLGSMIDEVIKFLSEKNEISSLRDASSENQKISVSVMKVIFK
jgi:hypothetical protein